MKKGTGLTSTRRPPPGAAEPSVLPLMALSPDMVEKGALFRDVSVPERWEAEQTQIEGLC